MKNTIKDNLRHLSGILLLVGTVACTTEPMEPGTGMADSQDRSPMTIELGVASAEAGIRTRA